MKAIIIARVSTEEQKEAGNSLPAQIARLQKYCQSKGLEVVREFSYDESAYKDQRAEFDSILDYVIAQKDKIAVCFDKVDRLSRNVFDTRVSTLYDKATNDEIELHFPSDGQIITSKISAVEKFQFGMSLGLAKYFSDAISDSVKRGLEQKLRKGEFPGKAPYGYQNIRISDDKREIILDETTSVYVQKAYELYATGGYSLDLLRQKLKADYSITWSHSCIDKILKNTFYYGMMLWKGNLYPHKYQPTISKALFDQVMQIKAGFNKRPFKYAGKPYYYRGLLHCGHCGLAITPEKHKGHVYYHCTQYNGKHGAKWIREEDITKQLGDVFKKLQLDSDTVDKIVETLRSLHENKIEFRNNQYESFTKERNIYSQRCEKLYMDKLDGRITEQTYDNFYQSFQDKIAEVDARLAMLQDAEDNYYITANYILELAKRAHELFESSEVEERRQLLRFVLSNLTLDSKTVRYEAVKPFDTILNFKDHPLEYPVADSNC